VDGPNEDVLLRSVECPRILKERYVAGLGGEMRRRTAPLLINRSRDDDPPRCRRGERPG
jgi:hypothetical protein